MAIRYCGSVKIDCKLVPAKHMPHGEQYKCTISFGKAGVVSVQHVGLPAHLTEAIDSPKAYDDAARAALSFATSEDTALGTWCDYNDSGLDYTDSGYAIRRSLGHSKRRRS